MKFECPTSLETRLADAWQSLGEFLSKAGSLCVRNQTGYDLDICTPDGFDLLVMPEQTAGLDRLLSCMSDLDADSFLVALAIIVGTQTLDCQPVDQIVLRHGDASGPYLATDMNITRLPHPIRFPVGDWRTPMATEFQPRLALLGVPDLREAPHLPVALASLDLEQLPDNFPLDLDDITPDTESHILLSKYNLHGLAEGFSAHLVETSCEGRRASLIYSDITLDAARSGASA